MGGDSQPCFWGYRYHFPQNTQLSGGYLSYHHRYNGSNSIFQVKMISQFHRRSLAVYLACYWNHLPDCLAGAANKNQTLENHSLTAAGRKLKKFQE
jgi:hypothetical protein